MNPSAVLDGHITDDAQSTAMPGQARAGPDRIHTRTRISRNFPVNFRDFLQVQRRTWRSRERRCAVERAQHTR